MQILDKSAYWYKLVNGFDHFVFLTRAQVLAREKELLYP